MRGAQWTPTWDLQLQPDTNTVNLSLAGLVAQSSGEDWTNATLLLSTAIPSHAVKVPKLTTWKIGVANRFIPTPTPVYSPVAPAPPTRPLASARSEEDLVRTRLQRLGVSTQGPMGRKSAESGYGSGEVTDGRFRNEALDFDDDTIEGELVQPDEEVLMPKDKAKKRPAPPPPPAPARDYRPREPMAQSAPASTRSESKTVAFASLEAEDEPAPPVSTFSLAPPPAWRPPNFGADSPVTLAAGYDLSFTSLQKETVPPRRRLPPRGPVVRRSGPCRSSASSSPR